LVVVVPGRAGVLGVRGQSTKAQNSLPSGSARTLHEISSSCARSSRAPGVHEQLDVGGRDVDVDAVLHGLGFGNSDEDQ
jgi:hypothetical protein